MLFNSIEFIIFFLLVVSAIIIFKNRKFQHYFLLLSSYFFFYFTSNYLLTLLIISTILDYYVGKYIAKTNNPSKKKILLILSLAGNLGLLGFFKYADFAVTQFNILGNYFNLGNSIPLLDLALPIGISFYTFQTISYTVDIYRGQLQPSKSLREFALFVSFFPQLVAGPIVRAKDFLPQLREKLESSFTVFILKSISLQNKNLKMGITIMIFGFLKKMFFADNISPFVNEIFQSPIGSYSYEIILGTIAFGIQIYGDFSGYSDIAIGVALILGFKLPINFNKPYFAVSPADFWRRWHISLSTWLRDYLYIPLGGNKKSRIRTYENLFIVMIFGGLWHGASINFIIWGALHGVYLIIHRALAKTFPTISKNLFFKTRFGKIITIMITQYFVLLAWIPFITQNIESMIYSMQKFVFLDMELASLEQFILTHKFPLFLMVSFVILHTLSYRKEGITKYVFNLSYKYWILFLCFVVLTIMLFYDGNSEDFIYFKF